VVKIFQSASKNETNKSFKIKEVTMNKQKISLKKKIEDIMACTAFAEAGEPCPIGNWTEINKQNLSAKISTGEKKSLLKSIENTMACTAFAEAGEPCPISDGQR
jgi:hypothetical protein